MKKSATSLLAIMVYSFLSSQVGISTSDPKQMLHVAGTSSTIRIEGLNNINNPDMNGTGIEKRVYAGTNGDLIVLDDKDLPQTYTVNNFTTNRVLAYNNTLNETASPIGSLSFTIANNSLIHVESYIKALGTTGTAATEDNTARIFGTRLKVTASTSASVLTGQPFAESRKVFTVEVGQPGESTSGYFVLDSKADMVMPAGTYTIAVYGVTLGSSASGNQASFVQDAGDRMRLTATPISY